MVNDGLETPKLQKVRKFNSRQSNRKPIFQKNRYQVQQESWEPKTGPKNAHLVENLNMGTRVLIQIETHWGAVGNDNQ